MTEIRLRKATIEDISTLLAIENKLAALKTYSALTTEKEWKDELNKNGSTVYLILKDDVVVGDVSYKKKSGDSAYISGFAIKPEFQKQGIGRKTMEILLEELKDFKMVELVTHPENTAAIKIYTSLGFEIKERIENYFGDGEPRIKLVK